MRIVRFRIYGYLLLICVVGLSIGVCISFADGEKPLSDETMGKIYGGCTTSAPCSYNGTQGCNTPEGNTACRGRTSETCLRNNFVQSCRRGQYRCDNEGQGYCKDMQSSCPAEYVEEECKWVGGPSGCRVKKTLPPKPCDDGQNTYDNCTEYE